MKAKHELGKPKNLIKKEASIYYVVKGRKKSKNTEVNEYYEEHFFDDNPIEARKKAFSYYQNYLSILQENNLLIKVESSVPSELTENESEFNSFKIQALGTAHSKYSDSLCFDRGVALYMVINKPIQYMNKKDTKNERFLIHGIFNFQEADMREMIEGLIREYGYYSILNYDKVGHEEQIDFSNYALGFGKYSIIATPYNWLYNSYLKSKHQVNKSNKRLLFLQDRIKNGSLERNAFETRLSKHKLIKIIASFLNSNGGTLFYGINEYNRNAENVFKKIRTTFFKNQMQEVLKSEFGHLSKQITIQFIKVNSKYVAVFKVEIRAKENIFVTENNTKKFFIRTKNGIEQIKDQSLLLDYCINRKPRTSIIDDIIDMI